MKQSLKEEIKKNSIFIPILLAGIVALVIIIDMHFLQRQAVRSSAHEQAKSILGILSRVRSLYTSEVVQKLQTSGIVASHNYHLFHNQIPLPATFSMMIGQENSGFQVRLYSNDPFPWRVNSEGGPQDEFEKKAIDFLTVNPEKSYFEEEIRDGQRSYRFAIGDLMNSGCVNCHNSHPDSPKKDWETGDLRGVLSAKIPLAEIDIQILKRIKNSLFLYLCSIGIAVFLFLEFIRWIAKNKVKN